jgi:glycosyltransferase involved in cell wall biosynthesis
MAAGPALVLLTATFPYGDKSETFLETEIEVLADRFERVLILPSHRDRGVRELPANVEVVEMDWLAEPSSGARYAALASPQALAVLARTARADPVMRRHMLAKLYLDNIARNVLKYQTLRDFVSTRRLADAIFYDYWLENSTLALAMLRRSGAIRVAVSRAHNFDVYPENWNGQPVPFQEVKGRWLDRVFAIAAEGRDYLEAHVGSLRGKVTLSRLGVRAPTRMPEPTTGERRLVVSCSSLLPRKRVHLIAQVLAGLDEPLHWIHFGDGAERPRVEEAAARLRAPITWELRGHVPNRDLLRFYEATRVDAFISLSAIEGLPVSMMEAQSFGIPIVACAVHGVPEIVNERTGVLLDERVDVDDARRALEQALSGAFASESVRAFYAANFDAKINYNRFADELIALWKDQVAAD